MKSVKHGFRDVKADIIDPLSFTNTSGHRPPRGQCCDRYFLWFGPIICVKISDFLLNTNFRHKILSYNRKFFSPIFSAKYFQNQNIGPRAGTAFFHTVATCPDWRTEEPRERLQSLFLIKFRPEFTDTTLKGSNVNNLYNFIYIAIKCQN
jgi:hypothetical protein